MSTRLREMSRLDRGLTLTKHHLVKLRNSLFYAAKDKKNGSGWIRTADQRLMSPLLYH
jgi:hypothetical protein